MKVGSSFSTFTGSVWLEVGSIMEDGGVSPVYAMLTNLQMPFEHKNLPKDSEMFSDLEDDPNDNDYVPDTTDSESDSSVQFLPVGQMEKPLTHTCAASETDADPSKAQESYVSTPKIINPNDDIEGCCLLDTKKDPKKHFCVFCGKPQAKLKRHLLSQHGNERDLVPLLSATSLTKKDELAKLRNAGDHAHNISILKQGTGTVVVRRRKKNETPVNNFVPCLNCMGWFSKKDLWRHKCVTIKEESVQHRQLVRQGKLLLPQPTDNDIFNEIMVSLRNDPVSLVAKTDYTIKLLGLRETTKNGFDKDRHGYIRTKVRELARLVLELRKAPHCESFGLSDFLCPGKFKDVVAAVKRVASYSQDTDQYGTPSLALKLGHSLVRCCILLKAKAIETGDTVLKERTDAYHQLHTIMWDQEISCNASRTLHEQKKNTTKTVPLTDDVSKLSKFLASETEKLTKEMSESSGISKDKWERLAEVTLARIILFNRRRQGEASKMKLHDYTQGINTDTHSEDILRELSPFEKELCRVLSRIEITGKRGRIVPVILTSTMKQALDLIVKHRESAGVPAENPFVFARINNRSLGHIRGCDCIRNLVEEVDLQYPHKITSTGLRKHIATMSQLVNLQDNELDVVAQYLGHDIRTHREHYRLPTSTVQVAKVAKLLLAMEGGKKSPSGVDLQPDDTIESDEDNGDVGKGIEDDDNDDDDVPDLEGGVHSGDSLNNTSRITRASGSSKRDMSKRRAWSEEEKEACSRCFIKSFAVGYLPGKKEVVTVQSREPCLQNRTWVQIKNYVRNMIKKKSRK